MTKAELRTKYKALRKNLSPETIDDLSIAIANQLLTLDIWDFSFYHTFLSIETQKEVNTDFILNILSGKDKNIVIPKSDFETTTLKNYLLTDATKIKLSTYNIPEPIDGIEIDDSKIEVVFVPLFAFDKNGHRVGYGKGFYDAFLANCSPETITIGLSFFDIEKNIIPVYQGDKALNYCVTPKEIHSF